MEDKEEMYSLYVQVQNQNEEIYSVSEGKTDEHKRGHLLMYHNTMEGLDKLTSKFTSFSDMNREFKKIYSSDKNMHSPIIYIDKDTSDLSKTFVTYKIVFEEDAKELRLEKRDNISVWLIDYLRNNKDDMQYFGLLNILYQNVVKGNPNASYLDQIKMAVNLYLNKEGYMGYRFAYFKLKELDKTKEKTDAVYR